MINRVVRKIAYRCGVAGSVWTILFSVFISLFIPGYGKVVVTEITEGQTVGQVTSVIVPTMNSDDITLLVLTGLAFVMGILALVATLSLKKRPYLRSALMQISTAVILVIGLFGIDILLPAAILLIIAALGMREDSEIQREAVVIEG